MRKSLLALMLCAVPLPLPHVIDPDNEFAETSEADNTRGPIKVYGERPPRFRSTFIPYRVSEQPLPTERGWERNWRLFASAQTPRYTDLMYYCSEFKLISGYNYRLASEYWRERGERFGSGRENSAPAPAPQTLIRETIGAVGYPATEGIAAAGNWYLTQAQYSDRAPRPAPVGGGQVLRQNFSLEN